MIVSHSIQRPRDPVNVPKTILSVQEDFMIVLVTVKYELVITRLALLIKLSPEISRQGC